MASHGSLQMNKTFATTILTSFIISGCYSPSNENKPSEYTEYEYLNDLNEDGIDDITYSYQGDRYYQFIDRDFDGQVDESHYYSKNNKILRTAIDNDRDGYLETEVLYSKGSVHLESADLDGDGLRDTFYFYKLGTLVESLRYFASYKGKPAIARIAYEFGYPAERSIEETEFSQQQFEAQWCQECQNLLILGDCSDGDLAASECNLSQYDNKRSEYMELKYLNDLNEDGTDDIGYQDQANGYYYQLIDRNFDRQIDESHYYDINDKIVESRIDDNLDGDLESVFFYDKGSVQLVSIDSNDDGLRDIFGFYESGTLVRGTRYYPNHDGKPAIGTILYETGYPSEELVLDTELSQQEFEAQGCEACRGCRGCQGRQVPAECLERLESE